ncbi:rod shape-determining protein MreC [Tumebacillus sp. BK434]|uniref:rod shape-determining protein MreC n=1 Tax=Tumebacillus sp. BK434 TaxID=2512169 RepID=UPI00104EF018|nr:rod shape-determining protein MreC [Tumebacillus sp. BK434]TCP59672.1 rod shape-determining protein MreC [Tumebacillus sp. BK434]
MTRFFTSKRMMALLASFILLAALVGLTLREREKPTWPEAFLIDAFGWVQGVIYAPVHHVADFFEQIQNIKALYEENAKLKQNLNDYSSMAIQVEVLQRENKKLKDDLYKLKDISGQFDLVSANVVGRSPSSWNKEITIDVGSKNGVEKDMAVITANKGLVGRVYEVTPYHSKVLLLTDKERMGISAKVLNNDEKNIAYGIVSGATNDLSHTDKVRVEMTGITLDTKVEKGQNVVTSGLAYTLFPANLYIGKIASVTEDKLGLTQTAEIEPAASLGSLEFLYVVKKTKAEAR